MIRDELPRPVSARLPIDLRAPARETVAEAVRVLRGGGVVAYPTEHLYALGCAPDNPDALARVAALKRTPGRKPLLLAIADRAEVARWTTGVPEAARALVAAWPEGLTLVLEARPGLPRGLTGGGATIALRLVRVPAAAALVRMAGGALPATSANRSGLPATGDPDRVAALPGVDLILDAGILPPGAHSTLLDVTGDPWRVLRAGAVPAEAIAPYGAVEGARAGARA